ncbi:hypothetical protein NE235_26490 [Actinoallomurus spadix]|uniref:Uncharacterized protein n=1 Tax=Actinoallomurus spadix TaxID=79912 RepID=A0ABN0WYC0_9ACTN|nr:hypothetical protein [Actinoallomurus spadix]MCO5989663.1 hypothetical protein [Actinoallomurus spadix]
MQHPERSRRRRRDAGLNQVAAWTRRAVGVGIVLSGLLAAGLAHLLPGQAADRADGGPEAPVSSEPSAPPATSPSPDGSARPHRTHRPRLTPPATAPAAPPSTPVRRPAHTTSGGS